MMLFYAMYAERSQVFENKSSPGSAGVKRLTLPPGDAIHAIKPLKMPRNSALNRI